MASSVTFLAFGRQTGFPRESAVIQLTTTSSSSDFSFFFSLFLFFGSALFLLWLLETMGHSLQDRFVPDWITRPSISLMDCPLFQWLAQSISCRPFFRLCRWYLFLFLCTQTKRAKKKRRMTIFDGFVRPVRSNWLLLNDAKPFFPLSPLSCLDSFPILFF